MTMYEELSAVERGCLYALARNQSSDGVYHSVSTSNVHVPGFGWRGSGEIKLALESLYFKHGLVFRTRVGTSYRYTLATEAEAVLLARQAAERAEERAARDVLERIFECEVRIGGELTAKRLLEKLRELGVDSYYSRSRTNTNYEAEAAALIERGRKG